MKSETSVTVKAELKGTHAAAKVRVQLSSKDGVCIKTQETSRPGVNETVDVAGTLDTEYVNPAHILLFCRCFQQKYVYCGKGGLVCTVAILKGLSVGCRRSKSDTAILQGVLDTWHTTQTEFQCGLFGTPATDLSDQFFVSSMS